MFRPIRDFFSRLTTDKTVTTPGLYAADAKSIKDLSDQISELTGRLVDNAGAHNSIFRGKYLGASVSSVQYANINNATFEDLYPGDYWTINGINWRIAGCDMYLHCGDTELTTHHLVIVPDTCLYTAQMNTSDTTNGGHVGSRMYTTNLASAKTTINNAFSGHVVSFRQLLSTGMSNNNANSWAWTTETVFLMNEVDVFGTHAFGASYAQYSNPGFNTGIDAYQYPLFRLAPEYRVATLNGSRQWWWLRDVVSAAIFASCSLYGLANGDYASGAGGVRPAFLIS